MSLFYALAATLLVSLISFVGVFTLVLKPKTLDRWLSKLIAFATGTLLGAAFLDLLPEAGSTLPISTVLSIALIGMLVFFIIEKFVYWHHHHGKHAREEKPLAYLNLIGDGMHNFFDGIAIAASFLTSFELGVTTTFAVALHEIPQEIGDFSLLLYSGFSRGKALLFNFISALTAILGALLFFYFSSVIENLQALGLAFTGGMFIYIAAVDMLPEMHAEVGIRKSIVQFFFIILGILFIWFFAAYFH